MTYICIYHDNTENMDKLQELTDRLYNEGLAKGKEEGARILEEAQKKAEEIIAEARKQGDDIISKSQKEADDYRNKVTSDLKMAAAQSFQATRKCIEELVITEIAGNEVKSTLSSPGFVKELILAVAQKFSADGAQDIELVLPASMQDELEPFVRNEIGKVLGHGISSKFSKKISGGFTIGPKDGGYFISLTDETFNELITEYLRPVTRKLLFG